MQTMIKKIPEVYKRMKLGSVGLHYILDSEERKRIAGSGNIRYCYCAEQNKTEETTTCYG